jgi:hypothetical protein
MKNNEFPKKVGSLIHKRKEIKLKTFPINFKIIPNYQELFERIMQRKLIFHSHQTFINEKTNTYNESYLDILFGNLYKKKRNSSFSKFNHNEIQKKLSLNKTNLPILNKSQTKKKYFLKDDNLNKRVNTMSKEHLNFFKKNQSLDLTIKKIQKNDQNENKKNKSQCKKQQLKVKNKGLKLKKLNLLPLPIKYFHV